MIARSIFNKLFKITAVFLLILFVPFYLGSVAKKPLGRYDLHFLKDKVSLKKRECWTTSNPKPWRMSPAIYFDRITIHHSGAYNNNYDDPIDEITAQDIEAIRIGHIARGYGDIAYHFIIDSVGNVWEGRSLMYKGAHVKHQNANNIGIMLLGNYNVQEVNNAQKKALISLIESLRSHFKIKMYRVYGHRDLGATLCPGDNLYEVIKQIRDRGEDDF